MFLLLLTLLASAEEPPPIYGGSDASADEAPYTVALLDRDDVVCSGILIEPDIVLTAAHCTVTADTLLAGDPDLTGSVQERTLGEVQRHPDWRGEGGLDVAVIALDEPLTDIPLAPLNLGCEEQPPEDGDELRVYGWGGTTAEGTGGSDRLQVAVVEVTDADCDAADGCRSGVATGSELFAVGEDQDACTGDSGGPLVDRDGRVVGIVSRGATTGPACGSGGIYTRSDALDAWLIEMLRDLPGIERCEGGCGCASEPSGGWAWAGIALIALVRRRRR